VRTDPPDSGSERELLCGFLDYQRETVLFKTEGLTAEQLARTIPSSSLTLAGLLNHLALVEDSWFPVRFAGRPEDPLWDGVDWDADPDFEFRTAVDVAPEVLRARYADACARSREVVAATASLDELSVGTSTRTGNRWDLRWVLLHMIEETARHAGHADIIRETLDGARGL